MLVTICYQTKLGFTCSTCSKASLLILGCNEGKYNIYCQFKQGQQAANAQNTQTPRWLSGRAL